MIQLGILLGAVPGFVDATFEMQSMTLACHRFKGAHIFERIAELLLKICTYFQLGSEKTVATVTDK